MTMEIITTQTTTTQSIQVTNDFDQQHLWHPYASLPPTYSNIVIDRAEGIYIITEDGRRLIDGMSSWWASVHGYNHPKLNEALTQQLGKMAHVMFGGLTHQPAIDLGKKNCSTLYLLDLMQFFMRTVVVSR